MAPPPAKCREVALLHFDEGVVACRRGRPVPAQRCGKNADLMQIIFKKDNSFEPASLSVLPFAFVERARRKNE
jgi:uncharacterized protein YukJ